MTKALSTIPPERIEQAIFLIRGEKVMLDEDLADLYGVETGALVRALKRTLDRFPRDFMFQLTKSEFQTFDKRAGEVAGATHRMRSRSKG